MEKMPYLDTLEEPVPQAAPAIDADVVTTDWRQRLPVLSGLGVTLRELRESDAASLCALLTTEEVSRFISPPPSTVGVSMKSSTSTTVRRTRPRSGLSLP